MWDFFTEPEFQEKLDWMAAFVRDECEPLDLLFPWPFCCSWPVARA
jgi:acyl-CoA dehydrogenase